MRFVRFLSQEPLHVLQLSLEATILCPNILLGSRIDQVRKILRHTSLKNFLKSLFSSTTISSRHPCQILSEFRCHLGIVLPMGGMDCQLPFVRHARVLVQACLPRHCRQHLLVGMVVLLNLLGNFFVQPQRRILSSTATGTILGVR